MDYTSVSSIDNAIKQVNEVREFLERTCLELVRVLTEEGMKIAKMQVVSLDAFDTGDLEKSIGGMFLPEYGVGYVIAGAPYAVYVEYGTGAVGASSPHPGIGDGANAGASASSRSVGDGNEHEHMGYARTFSVDESTGERKTTNSGIGWIYMDKHGNFYWTRGYPARPFMYNTLKMLEEMAPDKASDMFAQM